MQFHLPLLIKAYGCRLGYQVSLKRRLETADRAWVYCRLQNVDFLTKSCYHFHHCELTINRLPERYSGVILELTGVIFGLTRVQ